MAAWYCQKNVVYFAFQICSGNKKKQIIQQMFDKNENEHKKSHLNSV